MPVAALLILFGLLSYIVLTTEPTPHGFKVGSGQVLINLIIFYIMCLIPTSLVAWANASYEKGYHHSTHPHWLGSPRNTIEASLALAIATVIIVILLWLTLWVIFDLILGPLINAGN